MAGECPRIYYDSNRGNFLDLPTSRAEIDDAGDTIREGAEVTIYMDDHRFQATLAWDAQRTCWVASGLGGTLVHFDRNAGSHVKALLLAICELAIDPRLRERIGRQPFNDAPLNNIVDRDWESEGLTLRHAGLFASVRNALVRLQHEPSDAAAARFRNAVADLREVFSIMNDGTLYFVDSDDWVRDRLVLSDLRFKAPEFIQKYLLRRR